MGSRQVVSYYRCALRVTPIKFQKQVNCNSLRTGGITVGPRLLADKGN